MELTQVVKARVKATAVLTEDGQLSVKLTAHTDYDKDKSTSIDIDVTNHEGMDAVADVLAVVIQDEAVQAVIAQKLRDAIAVSRQVAVARKEIKS